MNIFSFKKQKYPSVGFKQKLFLFLAIILVSISIFPVFNVAEAQTPINPQGPSAGCNITVPNFSSSQLLSSKSSAAKDEKFSVYFEAVIPAALASQCTDSDKSNYRISIYSYDDDWGSTLASMSGAYNYQVSYPVEFFQESGKQGFRQKVNDLSFDFLFSGVTTRGGTTWAGPGGTNKMYAYWHKNGEAPSSSWWTTNYVPSGGLPLNLTTTKPNPDTSTLPSIAGISANNTVLNNNEVMDYTKIQTVIKPNSGGKGLRVKYRVVWSDTAMNFGAQDGPDGVNVEWGGTGITKPQQFKLPKKDNGYLWDFDPYFQGLSVYFNYYDSVKDLKTIACDPTSTGTSCSNVVFLEAGGNGSGSPGKPGLPSSFEPVLNSNAWKSKVTQPTSQQVSSGNGGKPLGSVNFVAIPILFGSKSNITNYIIPYRTLIVNDSVSLVSGGGTLKEFNVEVYANIEDIKTACKADPAVVNKTDCDNPTFAKYGFAEALTQTTNPNETTNQPPTQTLYGFIIKIISAIVIFLTSIIYKIFAFFVVPVINALLNVRPYQDAFVNIIYPGWLILRNLANIFFIISLLIVGLRILFQQSAAGAARGFIIRLIFMALLVNFSLVIGQGVVGIADTVQSQFLPSGSDGQKSKVIEALGTKLMVEPIVSFRSSVSGDGTNDVTGQLSGDQTISDIAKPIVLLVLAVAAFFSFLAIAAFLAVRLVALMILYMASPMAYVGYVLDETKGWTTKWWQEFLKYAFLTPILVFFLNIAALVASTTSSTSGNVIKVEDTLAGDLIAGGLTIVSHFIVLLVIFAGMKYALSSGAIGAGTIVKYAQKGFKNSLTKWPGAAKDYLSDKAATAADKANRPGLAKAITAATKPWELTKATKNKWIDEGGKERRDRDAKRLSGIPVLTKNDKTVKDPLKTFREKEKEINEDNSGYLADLLKSSAGKKDKATTGAAMMRLAKNGDFDDILSGIEQVTGKKYTKDAAGLNKATQDIADKTGMTDSEKEALLRNFDTQAGKDKGKKHYSGNVEYKDGKFKVRALDNSSASGRFAPDDHKSWYKKLANARMKMGISEDAKNSGIDSMVTKNGDEITGFTETQLSVFNNRVLSQIQDPKEGEKFRATGNYAGLEKAYRANGGLEGLKRAMIAHNNAQNDEDKLDEDVIIQKANAYHQYLFSSSSGNNGTENGNTQRNGMGFTARPFTVATGPTVAGTPTAVANQSSQMDAAQNINNAVNFSGGPASAPIGNLESIQGQQSSSPSVGFAESNIRTSDNNNTEFKTDSKRRIGFIKPKEQPAAPQSTPTENPSDSAAKQSAKDIKTILKNDKNKDQK